MYVMHVMHVMYMCVMYVVYMCVSKACNAGMYVCIVTNVVQCDVNIYGMSWMQCSAIAR